MEFLEKIGFKVAMVHAGCTDLRSNDNPGDRLSQPDDATTQDAQYRREEIPMRIK
jgi:hypothetical protein